jgi:hypothetical protein
MGVSLGYAGEAHVASLAANSKDNRLAPLKIDSIYGVCMKGISLEFCAWRDFKFQYAIFLLKQATGSERL